MKRIIDNRWRVKRGSSPGVVVLPVLPRAMLPNQAHNLAAWLVVSVGSLETFLLTLTEVWLSKHPDGEGLPPGLLAYARKRIDGEQAPSLRVVPGGSPADKPRSAGVPRQEPMSPPLEGHAARSKGGSQGGEEAPAPPAPPKPTLPEHSPEELQRRAAEAFGHRMVSGPVAPPGAKESADIPEQGDRADDPADFGGADE